jgi:hypothetical protein
MDTQFLLYTDHVKLKKKIKKIIQYILMFLDQVIKKV